MPVPLKPELGQTTKGRPSIFQKGDGIDPRVAEMQNYVVNKIDIMKRSQINTKKLTQLCSFIPDFIMMDEANRKIPYSFSFEGVVLMADISGFTALTEAYSLKGKGGTDQLTKTLAGYIGPLAECILQADGDIVKYAGDAFIAYWKSGPSDYAEDIQKVVDCALYIQEKYGSYLCKDVDIVIRVKIGIGVGMIHFGGIGTETYQHWVAYGPGVQAASSAEKYCTSGDIVLAPSAWAFCSKNNYRYQAKDPPFIHILDILNFINYEKRGRPQATIPISKQGKKDSVLPTLATFDPTQIRPHIAAAIEHKPESVIRPYVIPPVLKKLDDDIPVEYLNESRVVCICFIHLKTDEKLDADEKNFRDNMGNIVQRAFVRIYTNVTKMQGALSKVIMFDKGLTYLIVFGFPGYINENQSAHALKFSYRTRLALKTIKYVTDCSIGVTTGSCYCGVIGHPRRQEYTVIGRKVNKAARLMCYYPGKLTCDQDTAYFSKLPSENFQLMEAKQLKGIKDVGNIYEFSPQDATDDTSIPTFRYPILGREAELTYFKNALNRAKKEHQVSAAAGPNQRVGQDISGGQKAVWMIIFEGDNGIGKSRMLAACLREAEAMRINAYDVGLTLSTASQAFFAVSSLVIGAVGMSEMRSTQEREEFLRKRITDTELAADLCLLNDVLHTKFPLNPKYASLDVTAGHSYAQHVLYGLLKATFPDKMVMFAVDDAHLMDLRSWEYLIHISKFPNFFSLCSLRRSSAGSPKLLENVSKQIYHNKHIKIIRMTGLDVKMLLPLACQVMQVKAIPADLEKLIMNKSNGVPAWVHQVLNELVRQGILRLQDDTLKYKQAMVAAEKKHLEKLKKIQRKPTGATTINAALAEEEGSGMGVATKKTESAPTKDDLINPMDRVLVIKSDTNIHNVPVSGTLKEILMDSYDELSSNEQLILKAATVLGTKFSRLMVTRLLPFYDTASRKYDLGFNNLMEKKYLRCASATQKEKESVSGINAKPQCFCREDSYSAYMTELEAGGQQVERRPKFYSCKFMEFVKENMVEVVYDVMTEDQRVEFHLKAAKFLDSSVVKCESCGGEDRSYLFGFVRKTTDYNVETEEALRISNKQQHRRTKLSARDDFRRRSNISFHSAEKQKKSVTTQLNTLRRTFESIGTKVGHVELDILKGLIELDNEQHTSTWDKVCCCCRNKMEEKEAQDQQDEIKEFEKEERSLLEADPSDMQVFSLDDPKPHRSTQHSLAAITEEKNTGMLPISYDVDPANRKTIGPAGFPRLGSQADSANANFVMVDLRLCQCALLQAKVCVEMVWHYREAKKYGKCLDNLLDAAEADVTVGDGTQALVRIDDAMGLLKRIKDGDLPPPDKDDPDDALISETDAEAQIEFLSGLAYFEIGVNTKAREYFMNALHRLGLMINYEDASIKRDAAIFRAKMQLRKVRYCNCCRHRNKRNRLSIIENEAWQKKMRILAYLHSLFKSERKIEMAYLITLWEVIIAEQYGHIIHDIIPAYAHMMDIYSSLSQHKMAKKYEKLSLRLIRTTLGSEAQIEPVGLVTSANLFLNIAAIRLNRGEIDSCSKAACLALSISQTVNDNGLTVRILPLLCQALLLTLKISELAEALQKLWFLAEESDDYAGVSSYYATCLDLLLNTAYPLEQFVVCENFIGNSEYTQEANLVRDPDTQFSLEASMALWYARYSRWDESTKWFDEAEAHKPKFQSFTTVSSEIKLLECQLIFVNHYLDSKRYQLFAKSRNSAKTLMRSLSKSIAVVPVLKPRYTHLMAYYYRIRSRNVESEKYLKTAEKLAIKMGNCLEQEWITHSRNVWADLAIPTVKYFWLEHTENHTLDWHSSGRIPWANIMYSLPLPAWK